MADAPRSGGGDRGADSQAEEEVAPLELIVHPKALQEFKAVRQWYLERDPWAEQRFVARIRAAFEAVCHRPRRYPLWEGRAGRRSVRKRFVEDFPYVIPYLPEDPVLFALAVAHQHRWSGYWQGRLKDLPKLRLP